MGCLQRLEEIGSQMWNNYWTSWIQQWNLSFSKTKHSGAVTSNASFDILNTRPNSPSWQKTLPLHDSAFYWKSAQLSMCQSLWFMVMDFVLSDKQIWFNCKVEMKSLFCSTKIVSWQTSVIVKATPMLESLKKQQTTTTNCWFLLSTFTFVQSHVCWFSYVTNKTETVKTDEVDDRDISTASLHFLLTASFGPVTCY